MERVNVRACCMRRFRQRCCVLLSNSSSSPLSIPSPRCLLTWYAICWKFTRAWRLSSPVFQCAQDALPYEATIHLSNDFTQRRDALIAAKERILLASLDYSTARTRFVDPFRPFSERSRYLLDSGDYCSLQIDQVSLMLPHSTVREVFDTIMENHSNIDMRITDVFGDITTCDETNYGVEGIRQSRFASGLACGVSVEMNVANFFHYFEHMHDERGGGPVGVFASDFVDRDDLYPYQSAERVRYDITGVLVVRKHRKTRRNPVTGEDEEVSAIVLTQSCLFKIRRPLMQLSPGVEYQLRDQLGQWGRVMMSAVLDTAHGINQPFQ